MPWIHLHARPGRIDLLLASLDWGALSGGQISQYVGDKKGNASSLRGSVHLLQNDWDSHRSGGSRMDDLDLSPSAGLAYSYAASTVWDQFAA